jgi:integrase
LREPIRKFGVRVLRADEYQLLRQGGSSESERTQMDALLYTGMRYIEAQRFQENPAWFNPDGFVFLPREAIFKSKRHQLERWVKLNEIGKSILPLFLKGKKLPSWQVWADRLKRAAIRVEFDPVGLGSKTMRKTWESWLVASYPNRLTEILLSQGHTAITSVGHYLNMPFLAEDKAAIRPYVEGMF